MFSQFVAKYGKRVIVPLVLAFSGILYFFFQPTKDNEAQTLLIEPVQQTIEPEIHQTSSEIQPLEQKVIVDIKGAVHFPGVYELTSEQRIADAIAAAGGYTEQANPQLINNAQKLQDEMVIYVPQVGEEMPEIQSIISQPVETNSNSSKTININTADEAQLATLPGIGPSKAQAIIVYRTEVGLFQSIEEIKKVSGIGEKTFEKFKHLIDIQ